MQRINCSESGIIYILNWTESSGQNYKSLDSSRQRKISKSVESNGSGYKFRRSRNFFPIIKGSSLSTTKFSFTTTIFPSNKTQWSPTLDVRLKFFRSKMEYCLQFCNLGSSGPFLCPDRKFLSLKVILLGLFTSNSSLFTMCWRSLSLFLNNLFMTPSLFSNT